MKSTTICSLQNVTVLDGEQAILENIELNIHYPSIVAMIAKDSSASCLIQTVAGLRGIDEGKILYPNQQRDLEERVDDKTNILPAWIQYVPDDIICYSNMTVYDFFVGVSLAIQGNIGEEVHRLCELFGIDMREELLNLTFEQNRLVAMIQAILTKPKLLLLDNPRDMISKPAYLKLWKEFIQLYKQGTTIVLTAKCYADLVLPCHQYYFLRDGKMEKAMSQKELPVPAKVITLEGGRIDAMDLQKVKLLSREGKKIRFLYHETNMGELVLRIYKTGCKNFNVEELTMEEELFMDYERWLG